MVNTITKNKKIEKKNRTGPQSLTQKLDSKT